MSDGSPMLLEGHGLKRNFAARGIAAVADVDICVRPQESVAIMGRSGSGKTSLLGLLCGLDRPDAGSVFWRGEHILSEARWRMLRAQEIGIVFQNFLLLSALTAMQNVEVSMFALPRSERRERAAEALKHVGLEGRLSHLPGELSGGEKQRVAIARAIAKSPAIVFADEPTGNLDTANRDAVMDLLRGLQSERNLALVIVTHDVDIAYGCQRIFEMEDGRLSARQKDHA